MKTKLNPLASLKTFIPVTPFYLGTYFGLFLAILLPVTAHYYIKHTSAYFNEVLDVKPQIVIKNNLIEVKTEAVIDNEDVWVANRIVEAGLNPIEAIVINSKESGYVDNDNKWNVNSNGSIDLSRWMINSIHYGKEWKHWNTGETNILTLACVTDYKCSTDWSISKRLKDGNWSAWYGARSAGIN